MGYRNIAIYGCDLFLTPRSLNKRKDYAPYQKKIQIKGEYDIFVCHEPYLNFIILKILFENQLIKPYKNLERVLNLSYEEYIYELSKNI